MPRNLQGSLASQVKLAHLTSGDSPRAKEQEEEKKEEGTNNDTL